MHSMAAAPRCREQATVHERLAWLDAVVAGSGAQWPEPLWLRRSHPRPRPSVLQLFCAAVLGSCATLTLVPGRPSAALRGRLPRAGPRCVAAPATSLAQPNAARGSLLSGLRKRWVQIQVRRARHRPPANTRVLATGAQRITVIAAVVNICLALLKLAGGILGKSSALVADAGHSMSDIVSDCVTLWAVRMAEIPPDADHPYGHGRFEAVGALAVSGIILAAGAGIALPAWALLRDMLCSCGCPSGAELATPGALALAACIVSIVSKEMLFRATDAIGRRLNSPVIRANAQHHRSDVWSSVVAVVGVVGARLGVPALDPLAALGVAAMVFQMGGGIAADAIGQLTDTTDEAIVAAVKRAARSVTGTTEVCSARARAMGSHWLVEVEVIADSLVSSASAADYFAAKVQYAVLAAVSDAKECLVRVRTSTARCPMVARLSTPHEIDARVREVLAAEPEINAVMRTMAHFEGLAPSVEVWIKVSPNSTVFDCQRIATGARNALLATDLSLADAQVHLALHDA